MTVRCCSGGGGEYLNNNFIVIINYIIGDINVINLLIVKNI